MNREGKLWRKTRGGREYGSWHAYAGGRIVNLHTTILADAQAKARQLLGGAADPEPTLGPPGAAAPPASRPNFLRDWAAQGGQAPPAPVAAPPPPPPPAAAGPMSPEEAAMLAKVFCAAATEAFTVGVQLGVRYLGNRQPAAATERERHDAGATMELVLADFLRRVPIRPWHVLALQGGVMGVRMWREGTPVVTFTAPVEPRAHAQTP